MKNNNYIVLLMAILCFTILPSFTIFDEDNTIPETEINAELDSFIAELKVELNRRTTALINLIKIEESLSKIILVNPGSAIWVYTSAGCGSGRMSSTFSWLNDQANVDWLCDQGQSGQASYKYKEGNQDCHPVGCSL